MPFRADFAPSLPPTRRLALRYLLALAAVGAATLFRLAVDPLLGNQVPFFVYVAAVVVATWVAGVGGGVLATVVSAIAANYFFVPPRHQFDISQEDLAAMAVFGFLSFGLVWLVGRWRAVETAAREAHARLVAVVGHMPVGVVVSDAAGNVLFANPEVERIFGRPFAASTFAEYRELNAYTASREDGQALPTEEAPISRALKGITVSPEDVHIVRSDGARLVISTCAAAIRDDRGLVTGAVLTMMDVTAQRAAAEELLAAQQRYSAIFENAPFAIVLTDWTDGTVVSANAAFFRLFECRPEEAIGRTAVDLGIVDRAPQAQVRAALEERGFIKGLEVTRSTATSSLRHLSLSVNRLTLEARPFVVTMIEDVTDRRRAEDSLRESEARFRSVLDGSRDVVYRMDARTGQFEYISPSAESVVGYSQGELMAFDAESSLAMVHPEDVPALRAAVARLTKTGVEEAEYRQRTKRGEYRWVSNLMSLVRDGEGGPLFRDGNIRDVTERKRIDVALQETLTALEHANRLKDEFLATLSHELRTPLNAVLGWSDMLLRPGLPPDTQRRALESINRNARAQAALISDILDVSRIITGKLRLEVRPVDIAEVVKAAHESIQPAAAAKGVEVRALVEGRPVLIADPDRLQQVLWNLLSNSVKFCERGGRIDVEARRADSQVQVVVRDDGAGISRELLPHVFERFRQADSSTTRLQAGLGLGLAIVRHLVELHGGTVAADSKGKGQGATFTVTLPVRALSDPVRPSEFVHAGSAAQASQPGASCLDGLRVVVVDDQEEARTLIRAVLERYGALVTTRASAEDGLAAVVSVRPDLLLADIGMPGMDGYELMRRIRALPDRHAQSLPAIALTAYGGAHDKAEALAAGYWEHLAKPITPDALVAAVAAVAGQGARR
jgi:PAS domain S-box-containing protein